MTTHNSQKELVESILAHQLKEEVLGYSSNAWFGGLICIKNRPKRTHPALVHAFRGQVSEELSEFVERLAENMDTEVTDCVDGQTLFEWASPEDISQFQGGLFRRNGLLKWSVLSDDPSKWAMKVEDIDKLDNIYLFLYIRTDGMKNSRFTMESLQDVLKQHLLGGR